MVRTLKQQANAEATSTASSSSGQRSLSLAARRGAVRGARASPHLQAVSEDGSVSNHSPTSDAAPPTGRGSSVPAALLAAAAATEARPPGRHLPPRAAAGRTFTRQTRAAARQAGTPEAERGVETRSPAARTRTATRSRTPTPPSPHATDPYEVPLSPDRAPMLPPPPPGRPPRAAPAPLPLPLPPPPAGLGVTWVPLTRAADTAAMHLAALALRDPRARLLLGETVPDGQYINARGCVWRRPSPVHKTYLAYRAVDGVALAFCLKGDACPGHPAPIPGAPLAAQTLEVCCHADGCDRIAPRSRMHAVHEVALETSTPVTGWACLMTKPRSRCLGAVAAARSASRPAIVPTPPPMAVEEVAAPAPDDTAHPARGDVPFAGVGGALAPAPPHARGLAGVVAAWEREDLDRELEDDGDEAVPAEVRPSVSGSWS